MLALLKNVQPCQSSLDGTPHFLLLLRRYFLYATLLILSIAAMQALLAADG